MTRDEIIERMRAMVDELNTLRGEVAMVSDHTYELDNLRARVRELEADKADMRRIIERLDVACGLFDICDGLDATGVMLESRSLIEAYKREHGGTL